MENVEFEKKMLKMLKFMKVVRSVADISRYPPTCRKTSGNVGKLVGKSLEMSGNVGEASGGGPEQAWRLCSVQFWPPEICWQSPRLLPHVFDQAWDQKDRYSHHSRAAWVQQLELGVVWFACL